MSFRECPLLAQSGHAELHFGGKADKSSAVKFHPLHVGAIARANRAIVRKRRRKRQHF
jgi:hypothetical protein